MPNMAQGFGPEGFEPSGGPQVMSAEQKLADMMRMMGGASNSVLQMIARILKSGDGAGQPQWQNLHQMPAPPMPNFEEINGAMPMRPSEPPRMPMMVPNPGFVRG